MQRFPGPDVVWYLEKGQIMKEAFRLIFRVIGYPFRALAKGISRAAAGIRAFFVEEPEDSPVSDSIQQAFEEPQSVLEHVSALRRHIFRALIALVLFSILAFIFLPQLLDWITQPIGGLQELEAVEVTEPIGVSMRVVLLAGFTAAFPYIIYEVYLFIAPALNRRARIIGLLAIPLVVVFFMGGMAFTYYVMLPPGLNVLLNFMNVPTQIRPSSYVRFITGLMFWMGLVFEFPLLSYLLSMMGILSPGALAKNWRIAVVAMSVLAAVITPTIDPLNMMLVMLPLLLLYGLSIILAYVAGGRRKRKSRQAPDASL